MAKLPDRITYIVGFQDGIERSLCVEASSPVRVRAFLRRIREERRVEQPLGLDHRGRPLDEGRMRVMRRQLYRHRMRSYQDVSTDPSVAYKVLQNTAEQFEIDFSEILDVRTRKTRIKMARRTAATALKRELKLDENDIAKILNFKSAACVASWLKKENDAIEAGSRGSSCPHLAETTPKSFSQVTSSPFG